MHPLEGNCVARCCISAESFLGGLSLGGSAKFVWEAEGEEVRREKTSPSLKSAERQK